MDIKTFLVFIVILAIFLGGQLVAAVSLIVLAFAIYLGQRNALCTDEDGFTDAPEIRRDDAKVPDEPPSYSHVELSGAAPLPAGQGAAPLPAGQGAVYGGDIDQPDGAPTVGQPCAMESSTSGFDADEKTVHNARLRNEPTRVTAGTMRRQKMIDPYVREDLETDEASIWWGRHEY